MRRDRLAAVAASPGNQRMHDIDARLIAGERYAFTSYEPAKEHHTASYCTTSLATRQRQNVTIQTVERDSIRTPCMPS
jgi:hypothetical protein